MLTGSKHISPTKRDGGTISSNSFSRSREIPIGTDLRNVLRMYLAWRSRKRFKSICFFVAKDDLPILNRRASLTFQRLRDIAGVLRHDGGTYQPRMDDFRYTFAVHRTTSRIKHGADLNKMLSALAAYMGQVGLGSTERYLSMTSKRFLNELDKLTPRRREGRWRNDKKLMGFLANL
jgi:integrase/recombinase XerD